jgi:hypothetical protein
MWFVLIYKKGRVFTLSVRKAEMTVLVMLESLRGSMTRMSIC